MTVKLKLNRVNNQRLFLNAPFPSKQRPFSQSPILQTPYLWSFFQLLSFVFVLFTWQWVKSIPFSEKKFFFLPFSWIKCDTTQFCITVMKTGLAISCLFCQLACFLKKTLKLNIWQEWRRTRPVMVWTTDLYR